MPAGLFYRASKARTFRVHNDILYKICGHCEEYFPATVEWFRPSTGRGMVMGLTSWCRACMNEGDRAYYRARRAAGWKQKVTLRPGGKTTKEWVRE